jgi:hypothetical protein
VFLKDFFKSRLSSASILLYIIFNWLNELIIFADLIHLIIFWACFRDSRFLSAFLRIYLSFNKLTVVVMTWVLKQTMKVWTYSSTFSSYKRIRLNTSNNFAMCHIKADSRKHDDKFFLIISNSSIMIIFLIRSTKTWTSL